MSSYLKNKIKIEKIAHELALRKDFKCILSFFIFHYVAIGFKFVWKKQQQKATKLWKDESESQFVIKLKRNQK